MPVLYAEKPLIPAPFIEVAKETITREDGTRLGGSYAITVRGKLVAWKGSPNSSGVFHTLGGYPADETIPAESRLTAILRKQEALKGLFATDGLAFEVTGFDGQNPFKFYPRVKRIEFPNGEGRGANWTEYCEYVITMEADCIHGIGDDCPDDNGRILRFNEEWNLESLDEKQGTWRLTRSLSATGRRMFGDTGELLDGKEAWQNARDYITTTIGLGIKPERMASSGVLNTSSLQAFNYLRTDNVNETAGTCAVTESWVCFDPGSEPPAIHERTVSARTNAQDGRTTVNVEGNIQGLEVRNNTTRELVSTRYQNALGKWQNHVFGTTYSAAVAALSGLSTASLNPLAAQATVGFNELGGTVNYSYEYDDRPTPITSGALSEVITVENSHPVDVFAKIPVLGRPLGPVLQSAGTVTERRRSISIELQMPATNPFAAQPQTGAIILALMPGGTVFLDQDTETWSPSTGRYNRNTSFTFE